MFVVQRSGVVVIVFLSKNLKNDKEILLLKITAVRITVDHWDK